MKKKKAKAVPRLGIREVQPAQPTAATQPKLREIAPGVFVGNSAQPESGEAVQWSDDFLRTMWRSQGGSFHGPNVETGTMPEAKLLPFMRMWLVEIAAKNSALTAAQRSEQVWRAEWEQVSETAKQLQAQLAAAQQRHAELEAELKCEAEAALAERRRVLELERRWLRG